MKQKLNREIIFQSGNRVDRLSRGPGGLFKCSSLAALCIGISALKKVCFIFNINEHNRGEKLARFGLSPESFWMYLLV